MPTIAHSIEAGFASRFRIKRLVLMSGATARGFRMEAPSA